MRSRQKKKQLFYQYQQMQQQALYLCNQLIERSPDKVSTSLLIHERNKWQSKVINTMLSRHSKKDYDQLYKVLERSYCQLDDTVLDIYTYDTLQEDWDYTINYYRYIWVNAVTWVGNAKSWKY